jgi:GT2 family glycosyltransferase
MSTLIGIVTFGNLEFTKLTIRGIEETITKPYDLFVVVGKPIDITTEHYLRSKEISFVSHEKNYGFPYSVNDIYDYAWKENNYDNLVIIGNDVIPYPYAIDSMIEVADTTDYDWICAREFDSKTLVKKWPEKGKYFEGPLLKFTQFDTRPWEGPTGFTSHIRINEAPLSDVHNLALFKKSVFDKIGYIDVNFYPAYYEDNDYVKRALSVDLKSCTIDNAIYFHFWSRTIHQGVGGSTNRYFEMNRNFYALKWGGDFGEEKYELPFDGQPFTFATVEQDPIINIQSREKEEAIIKWWTSKRL